MKKALLLINIGTPEELTEKAVKRYLRLFLMDKFVIDIPYFFRWILVYLIIVPFRAKKSLGAYSKIWDKKKGSPLKFYTEELVKKINLGEDFEAFYAMSYSRPFIFEELNKIKSKSYTEIYCLPMYPQYAESSSRSALEEIKKWAHKNKDIKILAKSFFYNEESFLEASAKKIKTSLDKYKDHHLLFSFHGLPEKHMKKIHSYCKNNGTCSLTLGAQNEYCYRAQCFNTAKEIAKRLNIKDYSVSFQSRLGRSQWILPYTVNEVKDLSQRGIKKLIVAPYAFTIDCLETEEEIENEIKNTFLQAGGESLVRVPCLNQDFATCLTPKFMESFKPHINSRK